MTRPQPARNNNTALIIGTLVAAALIALALFAGRGQKGAADAGSGKANFDLTKKPMIGQASAPVDMVVVEDFKCPICQQFESDVMPKIEQDYLRSGQVKVYSAIWPFLASRLPEDDSRNAAIAAECVYEHDGSDAFGQFKSVLFRAQGDENQVWATKERLKSLASNVAGIDQAAFGQCLESDATAGLVDATKKEVQAAGVTGTPSVFVNGERVTNPMNYSELKAAIDGALAEAQAQ